MADSLLESYNPLYDVHLRQYFAMPHMQKHLRKMGLLESSSNGNEVYERHHAMMDVMLKNREAQLMKIAELRRKLDAAQKVETCRRIRAGLSPESYRKPTAKPSRSLSRGRRASGGRQRRFSNSWEDKETIQKLEDEYSVPVEMDSRNAYKRLSASGRKFNYLHKMDDPTLITYSDNIKKQLDRMERFREVTFGVHSVARQPPTAHSSWFFRRRSINNMRGRKHSPQNSKLGQSHDSRTSCPPTMRKRRDSNPRFPPIAARPKPARTPQKNSTQSAPGTRLPPTQPSAAQRGRSTTRRETTRTTTTTTKKEPSMGLSGKAILGGGAVVAAAAGAAAAVKLAPITKEPESEQVASEPVAAPAEVAVISSPEPVIAAPEAEPVLAAAASPEHPKEPSPEPAIASTEPVVASPQPEPVLAAEASPKSPKAPSPEPAQEPAITSPEPVVASSQPEPVLTAEASPEPPKAPSPEPAQEPAVTSPEPVVASPQPEPVLAETASPEHNREPSPVAEQEPAAVSPEPVDASPIAEPDLAAAASPEPQREPSPVTEQEPAAKSPVQEASPEIQAETETSNAPEEPEIIATEPAAQSPQPASPTEVTASSPPPEVGHVQDVLQIHEPTPEPVLESPVIESSEPVQAATPGSQREPSPEVSQAESPIVERQPTPVEPEAETAAEASSENFQGISDMTQEDNHEPVEPSPGENETAAPEITEVPSPLIESVEEPCQVVIQQPPTEAPADVEPDHAPETSPQADQEVVAETVRLPSPEIVRESSPAAVRENSPLQMDEPSSTDVEPSSEIVREPSPKVFPEMTLETALDSSEATQQPVVVFSEEEHAEVIASPNQVSDTVEQEPFNEIQHSDEVAETAHIEAVQTPAHEEPEVTAAGAVPAEETVEPVLSSASPVVGAPSELSDHSSLHTQDITEGHDFDQQDGDSSRGHSIARSHADNSSDSESEPEYAEEDKLLDEADHHEETVSPFHHEPQGEQADDSNVDHHEHTPEEEFQTYEQNHDIVSLDEQPAALNEAQFGGAEESFTPVETMSEAVVPDQDAVEPYSDMGVDAETVLPSYGVQDTDEPQLYLPESNDIVASTEVVSEEIDDSQQVPEAPQNINENIMSQSYYQESSQSEAHEDVNADIHPSDGHTFVEESYVNQGFHDTDVTPDADLPDTTMESESTNAVESVVDSSEMENNHSVLVETGEIRFTSRDREESNVISQVRLEITPPEQHQVESEGEPEFAEEAEKRLEEEEDSMSTDSMIIHDEQTEPEAGDPMSQPIYESRSSPSQFETNYEHEPAHEVELTTPKSHTSEEHDADDESAHPVVRDAEWDEGKQHFHERTEHHEYTDNGQHIYSHSESRTSTTAHEGLQEGDRDNNNEDSKSTTSHEEHLTGANGSLASGEVRMDDQDNNVSSI